MTAVDGGRRRRVAMARGQEMVSAVAECEIELASRFPAAFGKDVRPLKVGIDKDAHSALDGLFSRSVVNMAIGRHVRSRRYIESLIDEQVRVDLGGAVVARIGEAEKGRARAQLREMDEAGTGSGGSKATRARSQLLKRFEMSAMGEQAFADRVELDLADLSNRLRLARQERADRAAAARDLVDRWKGSGLSKGAFCKRERVKLHKLNAALEKAGEGHAAKATGVESAAPH